MSEPDLYQYRMRATWNDNQWSDWENCSEGKYNDCIKTPLLHDWVYEARKLFAEPFDIEPPRYAKRLINLLREQLAEQTALVDKWYDRSVVLEQEKFKLNGQLAEKTTESEKWHTMAVELDVLQQQMTDLLRSEREEHHLTCMAHARSSGDKTRRIDLALIQCELSMQVCSTQNMVKAIQMIHDTLSK